MNETRLRQLLPRASKSTIALNVAPDRAETLALLERAAGHEQVAKNKRKARDPRSRRVRIISRRRRLIDPGANLWGGSKYFEDSLRYANLLHDDSEAFIEIKISQEKVTTPEEECTIIEIEIPNQ